MAVKCVGWAVAGVGWAVMGEAWVAVAVTEVGQEATAPRGGC